MKLCPTNCGASVKPGHLMCGPCWSLVPRPLQAEVSGTWLNYRRAFGRSAPRATITGLLAEYRKAAYVAAAAAATALRQSKRELRA